MPIKTTLYWVFGILVMSAVLVSIAADFTEQQAFGASRLSGQEPVAVPQGPGADRFVVPEEAEGFFAEESEAMSFESEPNLDTWYENAGASDEPFDPSPEDHSYLINNARPTTRFDDHEESHEIIPVE